MSLPVAALGAVVAALLELSIVPYLRIGGAQPDLVLVLAIAWTIVAGLEGGLAWAFLGGLVIDVLAPRPLGSTSFSLLLCVGAAALLGWALEPVRVAAPVIATFVLAILYAVVFLLVYGALRTPIAVPDLVGAILPRAVYDAAIAALIGPPALWWLARRRPPRAARLVTVPADRGRSGRMGRRMLALREPLNLGGQAAPRLRSSGRFLAFGLIVVIAVAALTVRLGWMQLVDADRAALRTATTRIVLEPVASTRGLIYDRAGRPLVTNIPMYAVKVRPSELGASVRDDVVNRLSGLLGLPATEIHRRIDAAPGSRFDLVRIAADVPEDTARLISEERPNLPGVEVVVESRRNYLEGALFAQVLGYTGAISAEELQRLAAQGYLPDDLIGRAGVEATYETALRGTYGLGRVERDAAGRTIHELGTLEEAVAGNSLQLTINSREQRLAQRALEWGIEAAGLKRGVVIVMNPQTGEVLALVSLPTYDNNRFAGGIADKAYQELVRDPGQPLLNHAISEHFPPGSTYKLVTATGGLADGKITPTSRLMTKGYLSIGTFRYPEWNGRGWGLLDIYGGFGHSSDTFFYQVAGMLGIDRLAHWAHEYGFGAPTGIDLPGEVSGIVPSNQWKLETLGQPIYPGEVYHAGIGQGFDAVTPIQLIRAYAALANGGSVLEPQVVRQVVAPDGTVVRGFKPKLAQTMDLPANVLETMRKAARTVVTIRHTYNLVELPIKVAGKSGTAEFGLRDAQGRLPFHSWFVGFVPKDPYNGSFEDPDSQLMVLAFAYDSRTVGNAATEIVKYYLQLHFGIEQDYRIPDLLERGNFYQSP